MSVPAEEILYGTHRDKGQTMNPAKVEYPRKRALIACELCRKKKQKCDNRRPTCGSCETLHAECIYREPNGSHASFDLASLEILNRINYVAELLESQVQQSPGSQHTRSVRGDHESGTDATFHFSPNAPSMQRSEEETIMHNEDDLLLESLQMAGRASGSSEKVLQWPIFEGRFSPKDIQRLIFRPTTNDSENIGYENTRLSKQKVGIRENDALFLVDRFLRYVHVKNPIFEVDDLRLMAKDIMETGYQWNERSCLVLIVCALGGISKPFKPEVIKLYHVEGPSQMTGLSDTTNYAESESYYTASQKRIGLLGNSIMAAQCCFLSGVYEMYTLRPLRAWTSFNKACITFQLYLRNDYLQDDPIAKSLERRLYWSCLKSECEMRMEIDLPPSGLAKVNDSDVFPTPPKEISERGHDCHSTGASHSRLLPELEKSWGYYLSDIAVRQIGNRLMNTFYKEDESSWLTMPLDRVIRVAEEIDLQLTHWYENLPISLAVDDSSDIQDIRNELFCVLEVRLYQFRERVYRPFLYRAMHSSQDHPIQRDIRPYAQRCLEACLAQTLKGCYRHRHHGTWFRNRELFTESLLLLAAVKSRRVQVSGRWEEGVLMTIAGLKFWEDEAPDLREARMILEQLLCELRT